MTKCRNPLSIEEGVTRVLGAIGTDAASEVTGKSGSLLRAWGDPDNDTHHIPLRQAIALDVACVQAGGNAPLLLVHKAAVLAARRSQHDATPPMERLAELMGAFGDTADEVRAAVAARGDGGVTITVREGRQILASIAELRACMDALERDVSAKMDANLSLVGVA